VLLKKQFSDVYFIAWIRTHFKTITEHLNQFSAVFNTFRLTCGPAHERWWRPGWVRCPPPAHTSSWSYRCHLDKRFLKKEQSTEWENIRQKKSTTEPQIWYFTVWRVIRRDWWTFKIYQKTPSNSTATWQPPTTLLTSSWQQVCTINSQSHVFRKYKNVATCIKKCDIRTCHITDYHLSSVPVKAPGLCLTLDETQTTSLSLWPP